MTRAFSLIDVEPADTALCVRIRQRHLDELQVNQLGEELLASGPFPGCARLILRFGNDPLECLYSVFLAKLLTLQRLLADKGCCLILSEMHPVVRNIFEVCKIADYFVFTDTVDEALTMPLPDPLPGKKQPPVLKSRHEPGA
jgi:hypothetical protein